MTEVKVSVIVPVYQVEETYLRQCIESVLKQTLSSIELILVDDGSTDASAVIIEEYRKNDDRVITLHQKNQGVSAARNNGLRIARGEWVTFVDSDDYIAHDNCQCVYERAMEDQLDVLLWGSYKCYGEENKRYMPYTEDIRLFSEKQKEQLQLKTMVGNLSIYEAPSSQFGSGSACSKLYRRSFLTEHQLYYPEQIKRAEDVNFNIRVFDAAKRIGYLNQHFYYYRQLSSSATYVYREHGIDVFTSALMGLKQFISETNKPELFWQVFYMRCIFFFLESMDMDYLHKDNKQSVNQKIKAMKQTIMEEPYADAVKKIDSTQMSFFKKIPVYLLKHNQMWLLMKFYSLYRIMLKG
ncbi:MAG: glycosyltransferase [Clostridia bacterium]|nr:glycosyltransferase [Clostridia bacterium]